MPVMNGFELIQHLKDELKSDVPVIVLSSLFSNTEVAERILQLGASQYLNKTDSPLGIIGALREVALQAS